MAARESPQIIEEERERAESPTPLAEGLMRSYRGPGGGECSAVQLRLIGLSEVSSVFSPKNGYMAYKKIAIWQRRLVHTQPYTAS